MNNRPIVSINSQLFVFLQREGSEESKVLNKRFGNSTHRRKTRLQLLPNITHKNLRWINIKAKTIKLLEETIDYLHNPSIEKDYLAYKNKYSKEKRIYKLDFINILKLVIIKRSIKNKWKIKRKYMWYIYMKKDLYLEYVNNSYKSIIKTQTTHIFKWAGTE